MPMYLTNSYVLSVVQLIRGISGCCRFDVTTDFRVSVPTLHDCSATENSVTASIAATAIMVTSYLYSGL